MRMRFAQAVAFHYLDILWNRLEDSGLVCQDILHPHESAHGH